MGSRYGSTGFFFGMVDRWHQRLHQSLYVHYANCFTSETIVGEPKGAYYRLQQVSTGERKQQLFLRAMTNGNLQERDRLLSYTVGEFYSEMSLYITECDQKNKELENLKRKK